MRGWQMATPSRWTILRRRFANRNKPYAIVNRDVTEFVSARLTEPPTSIGKTAIKISSVQRR
jgi:hypothetical protein